MCYARRQRSSWARIKLSKILYYHISLTEYVITFFRAFFLSFVYFCLSSILFFDEISFFALRNALYFSLVVQFSMTVFRYPAYSVPSPFSGQLDYYTIPIPLCQYLLRNFFEIFLKSIIINFYIKIILNFIIKNFTIRLTLFIFNVIINSLILRQYRTKIISLYMLYLIFNVGIIILKGN